MAQKLRRREIDVDGALSGHSAGEGIRLRRCVAP